jgi:F-type H+-transporting ATPase subunit b
MMEQLLEAEFWVAVAFVIFVLILLKLGVHKKAVTALDGRAARIASELDEARKLRDEAQAILAESEKKRRQAEQDAQDIIAGARAEAERVAAEAKERAEEFVARRTAMAQQKIAQAESQAVAEVRAAAAEAAVAASEKVLTQTVQGKVADDLIGQGIRDVKTKLN